MIDNNSTLGITPVPASPEYGRGKPRLGEGEEAAEPKPFSLGPEAGKTQMSSPTSPDRLSPMELAGEGSKKMMTPEEMESLQGNINKLKTQLENTRTDLQNPTITSQFSKDHYNALGKVVEKMNPDMRSIAKNSQSEFATPQHITGEPVLNYVMRWINGAQETLSSALNYVGSEKSPNPAAFLKLQYSVQRAVQRGELFASIIGASVSGIKTIMSTQLG